MKDIALKTCENTSIYITEDGMRHLGAVIGTIEYRENYVTQKVNNWLDELNMLCDIARIEPQAAYSCFVSGYKHKLTCIMRTIPNISHLLEKIDALILTKFIPAITGGIYVNPDEHYLLSLPAKYGGLGLPIFSELADTEFQNSQIMSENLRNKIIEQERASSQQHDKKIKENKNNIRRSKQACHHSILQRLRNDMSDEQRRLNEINRQQGASTWLTTLSIKEEGYTVNKNCFWYLLRLRYGWQLQRLPTTLDHALSCKKGGFISLRHNQIRDLTANLLKTICHDVLIEPTLQQLTRESLHERTANITDDARLDIATRGFWISGQRAFFDIRVFNRISRRYESQELNKAYEINEREKKRQYNERILEVEHGSFTPLVTTALGGMGREASKFYSHLSESIAEKRKERYSVIKNSISRKISFALVSCVCMCVRGSRSIYPLREIDLENDPRTSEIEVHIS